jgi:hypothetical protein
LTSYDEKRGNNMPSEDVDLVDAFLDDELSEIEEVA